MTWASKLLFLILFLFLTSPLNAFSFAVFGDSHSNTDIFRTILDKVNADPEIEFAVHTGDLVNYGKLTGYEKYLSQTKGRRVQIYQVMGNHDAVSGGYKLFQKYFGPAYYSFDRENAHFIILDNAFKGDFNKIQYNWLVADLKKNQGKPIFVFFHKPVFDPTELYSDYIMSERKTAEELKELFRKYRARYVITGHIHGFGKAEREGIIYMISGGAGGSLHLPYYLGGFYHYVKITVKGDKITDKAVKLDE